MNKEVQLKPDDSVLAVKDPNKDSALAVALAKALKEAQLKEEECGDGEKRE